MGGRSEPARSAGAANSRRPAAPPAGAEVVAKAQRRKFTTEYKLAIVEEADRATDPGEIGSLLRREGLYSSHLVEWRRLRAAGALSALSKKRGRKPARNPLAEENQKLKAQVARLEKKLQQAEIIIGFFRWYNHEHHHSGIAMLMPHMVRDGFAAEVLDNRQRVLTAAFQQHPERFVRKPPRPAPLPDAVWINPPKPGPREPRETH